MGAAPEPRSRLAMPDPVRLVGRSLSLLRRLGLPDEAALEIIVTVARRVRYRCSVEQAGNDQWLSIIVSDAEKRLAALTPSHNDQQENNHADGTRRTTTARADPAQAADTQRGQRAGQRGRQPDQRP